jgi:prevent-host-death family protein
MTIMIRMTDFRENDGSWSVAEAKARFSQLVEQAQSKGPQTITKHGVVTAVLVSAQEWNRKTKRTGNLAEFFANSPLRNSGIKIARKKDRSRKVDV